MRQLLTIPPQAIHIWQVNLDLSKPQLSNLWDLLSPTEQQRALRFKFDQHRNRFIAAKGSLRILLSRYLSKDPVSIDFFTNKYGKPFLTEQNENAPLYFNASDSQDLALFALSHEELIGVDIEYMRTTIDNLAIGQRFFSAAEYQFLSQFKIDQQQKVFFQIWTLKEAFIKALGLGLSFPLKDFDVAIDDSKAYLAAVRGHNLHARDWTLHSFPISDDFMGALAIKSQIKDFDFYKFSLD